MTTDEELGRLLTAGLHDHAADAPRPGLDLGDVRTRARRIRRRRAATAVGVTAAAVLALVLPLGWLTSDWQRSDPPPTTPDRVVIRADLPEGAAPESYRVDHKTYVDGQAVPTPEWFDSLIRVDDTWVGDKYIGGDVSDVGVADDQGNVLAKFRILYGLVGSPDDSAAAWIGEDLRFKVWRDGRLHDYGPAKVGLNPAFVLGDRLAVNATGSAFLLGPDGSRTPAPGGLRRLTGATPDGTLFGLTTGDRASPRKRCMAAVGAEGNRIFGRCGVDAPMIGSPLSPDGSKVVATRPDALGSTYRLVILDARTGGTVTEIVVPRDLRRNVGELLEISWEDDEHLLVATNAPRPGVTVTQVLRIGLDGTVEQALEERELPPATTATGYDLID